MTARKIKALDYVMQYMIANKIPVTQTNYLTLAYFGDKSSIDELEGEELADLPEDFQDWPVDEMSVN